MIEDSTWARFDEHGDHLIRPPQLFTRLRLAHALPDLRGVDVHVAGASARTSSLLREVEAFWQEYFASAQAELNPANYGAVLLGLAPMS
jgi:hypothetical protein